MTPLKAIREICITCVGSPYAVKDCGGNKCVGGQGDEKGACYFWPYRMGQGRPSVKTIRKFCLECQGDSKGVTDCEKSDCPLYQYRLGKHPKRAGLVNKSSFKPVVSRDFSHRISFLAAGNTEGINR
jgi:hypothetical protein